MYRDQPLLLPQNVEGTKPRQLVEFNHRLDLKLSRFSV